MSEVAGRKIIAVAGLEITVKELSVSEIRAMLAAEESLSAVDVVGDFLFEEVRLHDLQSMTSLTKEQAEQLLPSQIEEVLKECKAMNRHFFAMGERLRNLQAKR